MINQTHRAIGAAILGNSIFGFSFMFSRMALKVAHPFVLLMYRFLIAALLIHCLAMRAQKAGCQGWLRFAISPRQALPLLPLGLCQPVAYFLFESFGISLTNATVSGVIIAIIPIVSLFAGAVVLREVPRPRQIFYSFLSIAGVVVLTLTQSAQGDVKPLGVLLLMGAVVAAVIFNLMSRKTSQRYSALERTWVMMLTGAAGFSILAILRFAGEWRMLAAPLQSPSFLASLAYLSSISSIVAFLMLNYANTELPVARTAVFCNLTTIISLFAGVVFLGEPFSWLSLAASVVIVAGVWGVQRTSA